MSRSVQWDVKRSSPMTRSSNYTPADNNQRAKHSCIYPGNRSRVWDLPLVRLHSVLRWYKTSYQLQIIDQRVCKPSLSARVTRPLLAGRWVVVTGVTQGCCCCCVEVCRLSRGGVMQQKARRSSAGERFISHCWYFTAGYQVNTTRLTASVHREPPADLVSLLGAFRTS